MDTEQRDKGRLPEVPPTQLGPTKTTQRNSPSMNSVHMDILFSTKKALKKVMMYGESHCKPTGENMWSLKSGTKCASATQKALLSALASLGIWAKGDQHVCTFPHMLTEERNSLFLSQLFWMNCTSWLIISNRDLMGQSEKKRSGFCKEERVKLTL